MDINEIVAKVVDSYGPWAAVLAGGYALYRQNINLSERIDNMSDKYIELVQKAIDSANKQSGAISDLADKQRGLNDYNDIVLRYIRDKLHGGSKES